MVLQVLQQLQHNHLSGSEMLENIGATVRSEKSTNDHFDFRKNIYNLSGKLFYDINCDSRETVPITLALLYLSKGDIEKSVVFSANFGRDSDTIGAMCGAISGAYSGSNNLKKDWYNKAICLSNHGQEKLCLDLVTATRNKQKHILEKLSILQFIASK